jgi:hypothetical protein
MQRVILFSSALSGASALTMRNKSGCSFHLSTEGAVTAPIGQYEGGQTRAGLNDIPSNFTLNGNSISDSDSRGCWWTPPALVLQCDVNQIPQTGFSIGCDNTLSFNGQTTFWECETADKDVSMIYLEPSGTNCAEITLLADGCSPSSCSDSGTVSSGISSIGAAPTYPGAAGTASTSAQSTSSAGPGSTYSATRASGTPDSGTYPAVESPSDTATYPAGDTASTPEAETSPAQSGTGSQPSAPYQSIVTVYATVTELASDCGLVYPTGLAGSNSATIPGVVSSGGGDNGLPPAYPTQQTTTGYAAETPTTPTSTNEPDMAPVKHTTGPVIRDTSRLPCRLSF